MEIKIHEISKNIQKTFAEAQEDMEETLYYGKSVDGKVKITINGGFETEEVKIDPNLLNLESKEILEKNIAEAFNSAVRSSQLDYQARFIELMQELRIPGF